MAYQVKAMSHELLSSKGLKIRQKTGVFLEFKAIHRVAMNVAIMKRPF
jgi:hypothetical protein